MDTKHLDQAIAIGETHVRALESIRDALTSQLNNVDTRLLEARKLVDKAKAARAELKR